MVLSMRQKKQPGRQELEVARQMLEAAGFVLSWDAQQAVHIFADFETAVPIRRGQVLRVDFVGGLFSRILLGKMLLKVLHARAVQDLNVPRLHVAADGALADFPAARATGCR